LLRRGVTDPSPEVRGRTLQAVSANVPLWAGKGAGSLLLSSLVDEAPAIRQLGINLASSRPKFWSGDEAREFFKNLLIDSDAGVRASALEVAERERLIPWRTDLARRVKALESDPALAGRARSIMERRGFDADVVVPDARLGRPRLLSLSTFRSKVNPLFYQPAEDGHSCVDCHGTHTILRIAPSDAGSGEDALIVNYNSALKVVNLGEPERSLILRKPQSPRGQGDEDPSSPTGLTHVGGPRWDGPEHPAYRAILGWIREASRAADPSDTAGPINRPVAPGDKP
jgi:cellulose synthase operon protein C